MITIPVSIVVTSSPRRRTQRYSQTTEGSKSFIWLVIETRLEGEEEQVAIGQTVLFQDVGDVAVPTNLRQGLRVGGAKAAILLAERVRA